MMNCPRCSVAYEPSTEAKNCVGCGKLLPPLEVEPDDADDLATGTDSSSDQEDSINMPSSLIVDSIIAVPTITETIVDGNVVHKGRLLVSVADRVNRNSRVYPESVWRREAAKSQDKVRAGMLTGQAEHPAGRPDLLDTIIKFTGLEYESDTHLTYADFVVIPTTKGKDFTEIVKAGVAVGCSTRGTGSVKREKRGSVEVSVIQDDYDLQGIDVMLFGEQSVESARLMQFEHIETPTPETQTESHMPEVAVIESLAALREAYPALLTEAEKPLAEELEAEKVKVTEATAKVTELTAQADAALVKLTEVEKEAVTLRETNEQLKTKLDESSNKLLAVNHLVEVARGQKHAAWLVVEFLKDAPTVQAVDEGLAAAVKKAESLIETTLVQGAGVQVAQPADNETTTPETPNTPYPAALSVATGTRIR